MLRGQQLVIIISSSSSGSSSSRGPTQRTGKTDLEPEVSEWTAFSSRMHTPFCT